jgi:hypothetical protein
VARGEASLMPKVTPPMIRCRTTLCPGVLGTVRDNTIYPAAHLVPTRHIWFRHDGTIVLVCPICKREHRMYPFDGQAVTTE